MTIETTAGTILSLSIAEPATYDDTGFDALTYTVVGQVSDLGEKGVSFSEVTFSDIALRYIEKLKGVANFGSQTIALGRNLTDAGQAILNNAMDIDGATVDTKHSIKIEYKDGVIEYYTALIMSYTTSYGSADQVIGANCLLAITGKDVIA